MVKGRAKTMDTRFTDISCSPLVLLLMEREPLHLSSPGWSSGSQVWACTSNLRDRLLGLLNF